MDLSDLNDEMSESSGELSIALRVIGHCCSIGAASFGSSIPQSRPVTIFPYQSERLLASMAWWKGNIFRNPTGHTLDFTIVRRYLYRV